MKDNLALIFLGIALIITNIHVSLIDKKLNNINATDTRVSK